MPPGTGVPARPLAIGGLAAVVSCVLLVGALHVVDREVNPLRRTISEYALGEHRWLFDAGVLALAIGSAALLVAMVRAGMVRVPSGGAVLLAAWSVGLVVVVAFEKTDWSVGPSLGGSVHRYAGLVAFLSLPLAALAISRRWRGDVVWGRHAAWTWWLGVGSLAWLGPLVAWFALRPYGISRVLPLGLLERGLALTELAAVLALGVWAVRASTALPAQAAPAIMSA